MHAKSNRWFRSNILELDRPDSRKGLLCSNYGLSVGANTRGPVRTPVGENYLRCSFYDRIRLTAPLLSQLPPSLLRVCEVS